MRGKKEGFEAFVLLMQVCLSKKKKKLQDIAGTFKFVARSGSETAAPGAEGSARAVAR